jgi:hypothetical protein
MKKWFLVFLLGGLLAGPARSDDISKDLEVTLLTPNAGSHAFINTDDCQNNISLQISWTLPDTALKWDNDVSGDAYLSTGETCDKGSGLVEIGDLQDVDISKEATSGKYGANTDDVKVGDLNLSCDLDSEQDYYFCIQIVDEVKDQYDQQHTITWRGGAELRWDVKAPGKPTITSISPGERNLKVKWTAPTDDDVGSYNIYYATQGSADVYKKEVTDGSATSFQVTGLTNYTVYDVWMTAVDETENEGLQSGTVTGTPEPVDDFYEHYRESGGDDVGGFCFVATAAYGSYQSTMVQPLRIFRDGVLAQSEAGKSMIAGYYRYGPRWARSIRGSETHRTVARWALAPAVAFAEVSNRLGLAETPILLAALVILLMLGWRFVRNHRNWVRRSVPPLVVLLLLVGAPAMAQEAPPVADFQLQIRFGPYYPDVDAEDGVDGDPFKSVFGSGSELLFELGVDYEILHGFGTVTAGGSFGFVQFLGKALTMSGEKSTDTTVLNLLPLRLNVGYHFDFLLAKYAVPLVPYVTAGISYYIWWVLDGVGEMSEWEDADGGTFKAQGGIFGTHLFVGVKLLLDFLDKGAAAKLYDDVGVVNTFLFAEFASSWVSDFNSGERMNVGDQTFMFGLMMEF